MRRARFNALVYQAALSLAGLALLAHAGASEPRKPACDLRVRVTNGFGRTVGVAGPGPADLVVEAHLRPARENRSILVEWDYAPVNAMFPAADSPESGPDPQNGAVGSSARDLLGERDSAIQRFTMNGVGGGTYEVRATVRRDGSKPCAASTRVVIR